MSTSGISSNLLSQIVGSSSTANQFAGDLNQLAGDLQSGNLSSAQQDYVTLSEDALNGAASSSTPTTTSSGITTSQLSNVAGSSNSSDSFVGELNLLGSDLNNGDLSSAQQDMQSLSSTAQSASSSANTASTASTNSSTTNAISMAGQPVSAAMQADIHAIVEAMSVGDSSSVSSVMQQLASEAGNSPGASYLQQLSGASSSSSSTTSSSDPVTSLLQSLNSTQPTLNLLA